MKRRSLLLLLAAALVLPAVSKAANPFAGRWDITPSDTAANHWVAKNGELLNQSKGANLKTTGGMKYRNITISVPKR